MENASALDQRLSSDSLTQQFVYLLHPGQSLPLGLVWDERYLGFEHYQQLFQQTSDHASKFNLRRLLISNKKTDLCILEGELDKFLENIDEGPVRLAIVIR